MGGRSNSLNSGTVLGERYRLERLLGEGGMGKVFLATHLQLDRQVALKILHESDQTQTTLLQEEARLLASLKHPRLAEVSDYFEHQGHACMVMDYIPGRTLTEVVRMAPRPISERRVRQWADELLDVLEYLHGCRPPVIVRDLKPDNIILDSEGHLKLIDFGIARRLAPGQVTSALVKGMGTEEYAPLEQYGSGSTDCRSDLYALGASLFFLLTGAAPPPAWKRAAEGLTVPDPREANSSVTEGLAYALTRLMALQPQDRPQSVAEVRQLLADAQSAGPTYSMGTKDLTGARVQVSRRRVIRARTCELAELEGPIRSLAFGAGDLLGVAARRPTLFRLEARKSLPAPDWGEARALDVSADGRWLALGHDGGRVSLWRLPAGERVAWLEGPRFGLGGGVCALGFLPGARELVVALEAARVRGYDLETRRLVRKYQPPPAAPFRRLFRRTRALAVSRRSALAAGNSAGEIWVWEVAAGDRALPLRGHGGAVCDLEFASDGSFLASAAQDGSACLWRADSGERLLEVRPAGGATCISYSLEATLLATGGRDGQIRLWDLKRGQELAGFAQHQTALTALRFTPDGSTLVSGDQAGSVKLLDLEW